MRSSLDQYRRPAALRQRRTHHGLTILIILALVAASALFLTYANWKQQKDAVALKATDAKQAAAIDASVKATLAAKIEKARKAEADAKAKAATEKVILANSP